MDFGDLAPDFWVNGSPISESSAGGIVNLGATQTRTFKWRHEKFSHYPLKVKERLEAKLLTLHVERSGDNE